MPYILAEIWQCTVYIGSLFDHLFEGMGTESVPEIMDSWKRTFLSADSAIPKYLLEDSNNEAAFIVIFPWRIKTDHRMTIANLHVGTILLHLFPEGQ